MVERIVEQYVKLNKMLKAKDLIVGNKYLLQPKDKYVGDSIREYAVVDISKTSVKLERLDYKNSEHDYNYDWVLIKSFNDDYTIIEDLGPNGSFFEDLMKAEEALNNA